MQLISGTANSFKASRDCTCALHCNACSVTLSLVVDANQGSKDVFSSHIVSSDAAVRPAQDDVLLLRLGKGQSISVKCIARRGVGKVLFVIIKVLFA